MADVPLEELFAALPVGIRARMFTVMEKVDRMGEADKDTARDFLWRASVLEDLPEPLRDLCGAMANLVLWSQASEREQIYRAFDEIISGTQLGGAL